MKLTKFLITSALVFALSGTWALAQDNGDGEDGDSDLDVTMTLLPENAQQPDAVTRELELPRDDEGAYRASQEGVENSAAGLEAANLAREDGRAFGQDTAAEAQENRENIGRESRPNLEDLLPDQVPDVPNLPDVPGPPATPPGQ